MANPIEEELERQSSEPERQCAGPISHMSKKYTLDSNRILGLLQKIDFEESLFVTCDAWKRTCGGVPRGSFILFRIDPRAVDPSDRGYCDRVTLARVTNSAPTPVESSIQQTLFQAHKLQAQLDPLTNMDLQWGALKASIIGTFYDAVEDGDSASIGFGNDVDTFFSPYAYVAYMPTDEDLQLLINSFVRCEEPVEIGMLRYTETPSPGDDTSVPILINPQDIVGEPTAAQRTANFGKTRFGKSNTNKIISQAVYNSGRDVAQVFFDPSGEYTYINDQDGTSLFSLNRGRSIRYSLSPKELRDDEREQGLERPKLLSIDFYRFPSVGHSLIVALWESENSTLPGYWRPVLDWSPDDPSDVPAPREDISAFNHYWRTMGMWYALLYKAGFTPSGNLIAPITFSAPVKDDLLQNVPGVKRNAKDKFEERGQPITVLSAIYGRLGAIYKEHGNDQRWFPNSSDGSSYFNDTEQKLLRMFSDSSITAHNYIRPFNMYHSPEGSSIFVDIARYVSEGMSIYFDMSEANEVVRNNLVERICKAIFNEQNRKFNSRDGVGERFVMFYFEEAHRLFRKDDSDLNSIYNLLAKEGAKLNIAMVYSTQSMTTISPDLLKNTDNFFIAHLDDDRETREVSRKYAFRDVADDVQRVQSKGYVRMLTRSHRFALPVQIHKFGEWR